jgi:hydrogenase expression/formation protein HypC
VVIAAAAAIKTASATGASGMCIGIPMRVVKNNEFIALCEGRGEWRSVNTMLIDETTEGQWLLVHLGSALRILDVEEAGQINDALDALTAALQGDCVDGYFADLSRT